MFRNNEIEPEVLLASACLPTMFQSIEIGGEAYLARIAQMMPDLLVRFYRICLNISVLSSVMTRIHGTPSG